MRMPLALRRKRLAPEKMRFPHLTIVLLATLLLHAHCEKLCAKRARVVTINPPTIFDPTPFGYSHIRVDTRARVASVAGQVAIDVEGNIVGTTLAEQLVETEKSLIFALEAVKAGVEDILKLNIYIKNFDPATDLAIYQPTGFRLGSPPSTLISTPELAIDGLLVEIEMSVAVSRRFVRRIACSKRKPF